MGPTPCGVPGAAIGKAMRRQFAKVSELDEKLE
jgi:hypothetical protein